jgi:hypothetical protein
MLRIKIKKTLMANMEKRMDRERARVDMTSFRPRRRDRVRRGRSTRTSRNPDKLLLWENTRDTRPSTATTKSRMFHLSRKYVSCGPKRPRPIIFTAASTTKIMMQTLAVRGRGEAGNVNPTPGTHASIATVSHNKTLTHTPRLRGPARPHLTGSHKLQKLRALGGNTTY